MSTATNMSVPLNHPAIAGHFPGNPIVPGAVLLTYVVAQAAAAGITVSGIKRCKFLRLVKPEQQFRIALNVASGKFSIVAGDSEPEEIIAKGSLLLIAPATGAERG